MNFIIKKIVTPLIIILLLVAVFLAGIVIHIQSFSDDLIFPHDNLDLVESRSVAVVFGAAVNTANVVPSDILADRLFTAADLYKSGKVKKIVVSGYNQERVYNEPLVMQKFLEGLGIPTEDIQPDYGGWRTYDTCYRAKHIFQLEKVTLVTQEYHLYRALYTCNKLGLDAIGVSADRNTYVEQFTYNMREIPATILAFFEVNGYQPEPPVLGDEIDVFEEGTEPSPDSPTS